MKNRDLAMLAKNAQFEADALLIFTYSMKRTFFILLLLIISMSCTRNTGGSKSEMLNIANASEKDDSLIFDGWDTVMGETLFTGADDDSIKMICCTDSDSYLIIMNDGKFFQWGFMNQLCEHVAQRNENFNYIDNDYPFLTLAYNISDSIVFSNNPDIPNKIDVMSAYSKDLINLLTKEYSLKRVLSRLQAHVNRDDYLVQIIESSCRYKKGKTLIRDLSPGILICVKSNEIERIQYRDSYLPSAKHYPIDDDCDWVEK